MVCCVLAIGSVSPKEDGNVPLFNGTYMHMKVTWIYFSYNEIIHLVLDILIFLNFIRLSNAYTLIHLKFG